MKGGWRRLLEPSLSLALYSVCALIVTYPLLTSLGKRFLGAERSDLWFHVCNGSLMAPTGPPTPSAINRISPGPGVQRTDPTGPRQVVTFNTPTEAPTVALVAGPTTPPEMAATALDPSAAATTTGPPPGRAPHGSHTADHGAGGAAGGHDHGGHRLHGGAGEPC